MTPARCRVCGFEHRGTCAQHMAGAVNRAAAAVLGELPAGKTVAERTAASRARRAEEYRTKQRELMRARRKRGKA